VSGKKYGERFHRQQIQHMIPEKARPVLIENPAALGAEKLPGVEQMLLFAAFDFQHVFLMATYRIY
jgi:hypothetical protein